MKTISKEYVLYTYDELSEEAKAKALRDYAEDVDYPFLQADLREYLHEELTAKGYTHGDITPLYSLSYCQGDGLMFTGTVTETKTGNIFEIEHNGHYYHERSTSIFGTDKNGNGLDDKLVKDWEETFYIPLCKEIRDRGYREIEYQQSEENFIESCEANEYTFLADGKMMNE